ncbi:MAG: response regulator [Planctomycetota bacterium]|nr:MAG: response regulator [Planctomycetota bacterium]REK38508.1 MAG: response regulator [Planctomycetota bacterium]
MGPGGSGRRCAICPCSDGAPLVRVDSRNASRTMKRVADFLAEADFSPELFASLQLGILVARPNWEIVGWNEVLAKWTGISADEVDGVSLIDRYPHLATSHITTQLETVIRTGRPTTLRPPLVPHLLPVSAEGEFGGLPMMQEIRIHRLCEQRGEAVVILRDVTAEQLQREAFHREHDQLVSVQQQLKDANDALQRATTSAAQAGEDKSEFLANMSHEIRCLMTAIMGYTDLLADGLAQGRVGSVVDVIRGNGENLLAMLDDVLDLSRIEAGKIAVHRDASDPGRLVEDVLAMVRQQADKKDLALAVEKSGPIPFTIQTDPTRVRQVLLNLLTNAVKYTETGGVTVRIHLTDPDPTRALLAFDVSDTGIGLDAHEIDHLFDAFAHGLKSGSGREHSAGLGLTISRHLAKLLGGDVRVLRTGPEGSTFRFTVATGSLDGVPLLEHDELPSQEPTTTACVRRAREPVGGRRVLFAEGGHQGGPAICALKEEPNTEVTLVENGVAAVEEIASAIEHHRPYDLLLLDEQIPLMDAARVALELRQTGIEMPIVAIGPAVDKSAGASELVGGCDAHLARPLDCAELLDTVRRLAPLPGAAATATL